MWSRCRGWRTQAKVPEAADSAGSEEPASPPAAAPPSAATADPFLSRLELQLPDGRYLLSYRRLEEAAEADA